MRNTVLFILLAIFLQNCALEQASPSEYNDAIYREQMKVKELITDLTKSTDTDMQLDLVVKLKIQTDNSLKRVEEIGGFRGDEQLHKAAMRLFTFYNRMANEGLDTEANQIMSRHEEWRKVMSDEEHEFLRAQGKFAETYELFL